LLHRPPSYLTSIIFARRIRNDEMLSQTLPARLVVRTRRFHHLPEPCHNSLVIRAVLLRYIRKSTYPFTAKVWRNFQARRRIERERRAQSHAAYGVKSCEGLSPVKNKASIAKDLALGPCALRLEHSSHAIDRKGRRHSKRGVAICGSIVLIKLA